MKYLSTVPRTIGALWLIISATQVLAVPTGYLTYTVPLDASPVGLAFDGEGVLYALEAAAFGSNTTQIRVIQHNNAISDTFQIVGNDESNFFAGSMAYDPTGERLLITDNTADGRIYSVNKSGVQQTLASGIPAIAGIAVRTTGEIFVSTALGDNLGEVLQIDRVSGNATPVVTGLDFGAGLAFDAEGNLLVLEADANTPFPQPAGRLNFVSITEGTTGLEFGALTPLLSNMQTSFDVVLDSEDDLFTSGNGGLFAVVGSPLEETAFAPSDSNFSTAMAFAPGALPFEPFSGTDAGRLAYSTNFTDAFVTLIRPTPAVDADFNDDLLVDNGDLQRWENNLGAITTATNPLGDSDGDFDVDGQDFLNWQRQLDVPGVGVRASSVPEPTSFTLIVCGFALLTRPGGWFNV